MSETNYIERYWRDAKPEDAIKEPPMVARLRDNIHEVWRYGNLTGCDRNPQFPEERWFIEKSCGAICQVYDAPDPGKGWRLIDPDKDDYQQEGIEYQTSIDKKWVPRTVLDKQPFQSEFTYRIRITPAVKYVPFTWEDRGELRGRWIRFTNGNECQVVKFAPVNNSAKMTINCYTPLELLQSAVFMDTGEPVGKKVQA